MLVIKNAKIYTMADKVYEKADIIMDEGKIVDLGENLNYPDQAQLIDGQGLVVTPGLVDAHSHIGCFGSSLYEQEANEMTHNIRPEVEVLYSIDVERPDFKQVLKAGITSSAIAPGSGNVIGGMVCAVKSYGKNIEDMCIKNPVALKAALGGNPKSVYGPRNEKPMTRMGIASILRESLIKGQEYLEKRQAGQVDFDLGLEHIGQVLRKEIPLKVHCEQFDMLTILRIAEEFDINFTLDHAWGASDFYDDIVASKNCLGVIYGPIGVLLLPGECGKIDIESVIELDKRGLPCAIMTDGPILNPDLLLVQAGEVMRFGGELERVLAMLTINPAKILGLDDRIGSIEKGKDADLVVFKGRPALDTRAQVLYTIVNGEIAYERKS